MKRILPLLIICCLSSQFSNAQQYGDYPKIEKQKLLNDLEILYQGLNKFHSGMYWYTPKDSVDLAFDAVRNELNEDLNVFEFHKRIAPLVALTREDHTDINLPKKIKKSMVTEVRYLPLIFVFLGQELYCYKNGSDFEDPSMEGKRVATINGETPAVIVEKLGSLFASDGFIKTVKYSDLSGFSFSRNYFYFYGATDEFLIRFKDEYAPVSIHALTIDAINKNLRSRRKAGQTKEKSELLEYKILNDSIAYLGVHSFSNDDIKKESEEKNLKSFLENSFKSIAANQIKTLVIDVSRNTGGSEGNEGLLYSYLGENYQKYKTVRVKAQTAVLDNGVDKPIKLKALGSFEKAFANKKNADGSYERKEGVGFGLMAYKKEPEYKYTGKIYVIIGPRTYSGASEFSNMVYTNDLATFVGQQTGGGYLGNTSGYSKKLVLPNSKIEIFIPALQFVMNVTPKLPFGSGVIPHHEVIPTFEQYHLGENVSLKFILEELEGSR